jgi:hypothetical protein
MNLEEQIAQFTDPQEFTRLCNTIFTEKYGSEYQVIDGTRSDDGNDGYVISEKRILAIHCPIKPERKTDADYLKKIRSDLAKAESLRDSGAYEIDNWTFITPRKLSNKVVVEMRRIAKSMGLNATHQESTFLSAELAKNMPLISQFPSLHIPDINKKLDEIIDLLKTKNVKKEQVEEEIDKQRIFRGDTKDQEAYDRVLNIRQEPINKDTKSELRTIYYKTTDPVAKLNALLGLLDFYDPIEDSPDSMVSLCDDGIAISESLEAQSVKALFLANKGYMLSFIYSNLDMKTAYQVMASNAIGFQTITEEHRTGIIKRLTLLESQYTDAFSEAINLTKTKNDFFALAGVLVFVGNAAGQRALYLNYLSVKDRATSEMAICRRAFMSAKEIYDAINDELNSANAIYNLANQIRFFGEEKEALELAKHALAVAKKYADHRLQQNAQWLIETLETGKIPDYLAGERRI